MLSVDEMREELTEYCHSLPACSLCCLRGDKYRCGRGATFKKGHGMTYIEITDAYDILVREGIFDTYEEFNFEIHNDTSFATLLCL